MPVYFMRSARLGFARWSEDDLPLPRELWKSPEVTRLISSTGIFTDEQIEQRLALELANDRDHGVQYWPVYLLCGDTFAGVCGLRPHGEKGEYEVGCHLKKEFWAMGLAPEAAARAIACAFDDLGASSVFAGHHPDNKRSQKVAQKLGLKYIGTEFYQPTGLMHPSYKLTRNEYLQFKERKNAMTEQERQERVMQGRELIKWHKEPFDSDQKLMRPQPPLVKEPMTENLIDLPMDFENLEMKKDFVEIIYGRRSNRVYTQQPVSLLALSFMLFAQQGIKSIRGNNYATLRTVPSAGGRHPFETYFFAVNVEGLKTGVYHYLPMTNQIELLKEYDPADPATIDTVKASVKGQAFATKASVIFYYSIIVYRGEWRYGFNSHRVMMMDAGHVTQNLYLCCSALGLGGCAIGALDAGFCNQLIGLDGEDETCFYCMPVGTISEENEAAEQGFYAWLNEKK